MMLRPFKGICIADYEKEAEKKLDGDGCCYYNSGSDGETTYNENTKAWKRYRLRPRVLRSILSVDLSTTVLGHLISFPVCVSPSAWHRFAHVDAEQATAKGAADANIAMTLSSDSTVPCREITAANPDGIFFMQSYALKNKDLHRKMLCRLKEYGFKAVVLTVDAAVLSKRRRQFGPSMNQRLYSKQMELVNYLHEGDSRAIYEDDPGKLVDYVFKQVHDSTPVDLGIIPWIKSHSRLPLIAKGILTGKAAREAVDNGADAVWISNHGGRQLDSTPSTIDVLSEVIEAVKGTEAEIYIDSGVRSGSDVFKALALGARAVFLGRPVLWGLAAGGSDGVLDVLSILKGELELCMVLSGCRNINSITRRHVIEEEKYLTAKL